MRASIGERTSSRRFKRWWMSRADALHRRLFSGQRRFRRGRPIAISFRTIPTGSFIPGFAVRARTFGIDAQRLDEVHGNSFCIDLLIKFVGNLCLRLAPHFCNACSITKP